MIEKRFTIKEFSTLDAMASIDVICDKGIELPTSTACDLLNELYEENEQLKSEINDLKKCQIDCLGQSEEIEILSEENERLKQVINENEKLIQSVHKELTVLRDIAKNIKRIKIIWGLLSKEIEYM